MMLRLLGNNKTGNITIVPIHHYPCVKKSFKQNSEIANWNSIKILGEEVMRVLIAEDDPKSRKFLAKLLKKYGECDMTEDGFEALEAYLISVKENKPYELICIDIMMPKFDGLKVMKAIRDIEIQRRIQASARAKIIITTALDKSHIALNTFEADYDSYILKPVDINKLVRVMQDMGLIGDNIK